MLDTHFRKLYESRSMAFGCEPDAELILALQGRSGRAVDLGGGQGRHCLPLARLGFEVEVVDFSQAACAQLTAVAEDLPIETVCRDARDYVPAAPAEVVVAALFFHLFAEHTALRIAERVGEGLAAGGLFYLSMPGFDAHRRQLAGRLLHAAGCRAHHIVNHLVTRGERPHLPVARRNETRAIGF